MTTVEAQYAFRQPFSCSADRAFRWCVDFRAGDLRLEGLHGVRRVRRFSPDTVLLRDTFADALGRRVTKVKLVRIRPKARSWTSTHLAGLTLHSQFWYRVVADGTSASHLEFVGLHRERFPAGTRVPGPRAFAARLAREDSDAWRRLASAMTSDLS